MIKSNLRVVLAQRNMTRYELAQRAGIRPAAVSEIIEIGQPVKSTREIKRVPIEMLDRICKVLQCDLSDILQYIPDDEVK